MKRDEEEKRDHIDDTRKSPWLNSPVASSCLYNRRGYKYFKSNIRQHKLSFHDLFIKATGCTCTFAGLDGYRAKCCGGVCFSVCVCEVFYIKTSPLHDTCTSLSASANTQFAFLTKPWSCDVLLHMNNEDKKSICLILTNLWSLKQIW